jgi:hypothetical protein
MPGLREKNPHIDLPFQLSVTCNVPVLLSTNFNYTSEPTSSILLAPQRKTRSDAAIWCAEVRIKEGPDDQFQGYSYHRLFIVLPAGRIASINPSKLYSKMSLAFHTHGVKPRSGAAGVEQN